MTKPVSSWEGTAPYVMLVMRIVAALLFFAHGAQKVWGWGGGRATTDYYSQRGLAAVLETLGPALLLVGLFPRFTAFILCGEMAVAYFQSWAPVGFWPITNGGEEAVLFCYFFLWMVFAGPGAWSLDGWLEQRPIPHPFRSMKEWLFRWEPYSRFVLRAVAGFLIVQHGARKAFEVLPVLAGRRNAPPLAIDGLPAITGYIDLIVGTLLIIGLFTRPAALIVSVQMLAAYFIVAAPRGPWPIRNGGGEALLHLIIAAYLVVMGAGVLSLDGIRAKPARVKEQVPAAGD